MKQEVIRFRTKRTMGIRRRLRWLLENIRAAARGHQW
jgi:hypothetical protein